MEKSVAHSYTILTTFVAVYSGKYSGECFVKLICEPTILTCMTECYNIVAATVANRALARIANLK